MNTPSIPQPAAPEQPVPLKQTFYNLVVLREYDYPILQLIAKMAGVEEYIVSAMFTTVAVHRADATKVLTAFSEYTQQTYTFDNVKVALHPTFTELATAYQLDLSLLAQEAGVSYTVIDNLLIDQPIPIPDARLVLQAASRLSGQTYTFDNVDLQLTNGETTDGKQE
jgi:hypothetical protein